MQKKIISVIIVILILLFCVEDEVRQFNEDLAEMRELREQERHRIAAEQEEDGMEMTMAQVRDGVVETFTINGYALELLNFLR